MSLKLTGAGDTSHSLHVLSNLILTMTIILVDKSIIPILQMRKERRLGLAFT